MAQFNHRIDLTKSNFPLLSSEMGRTVLVSNNRSTPTSEAANPPDVLYMHNVMPTNRGLQSVGFKEIIAAPTGVDATTTLEKTLTMLHVENNTAGVDFLSDRPIKVGYTVRLLRDYYVNEKNTSTWIKTIQVSFGVDPTVANVQGKSYILVDYNTPAYYNRITQTLVTTAFIGSPIIVMGITEAFGYLISWGATGIGGFIRDTTICWSSLINPLDLTPSAATGAGTGKVEGARGSILFCAPNSTGFLVYCLHNVVAAIYTGNKAFPFKFVPVEGSKGLGFSSTSNFKESIFGTFTGLVAYETDSYGHFSYSGTAGLQLVNSKKAATILPEVTDFLAGKLIEDFNETTKVFSSTPVETSGEMYKALSYVASRYLVISYGITEFTHALIYDVVLEKLGKIKFTHVDVYEHTHVKIGAGHTYEFRELSKENIAFIDKTGKVSLVSFNPVDTTRTGVLILGKYQWHRDRFLTLQRVTAENVDAADSFSCTAMASLDGRNVSSLVTGTETSGVGYRDYAFQSSAKNHSLAFIGSFILNSLELLFTLGGRR